MTLKMFLDNFVFILYEKAMFISKTQFKLSYYLKRFYTSVCVGEASGHCGLEKLQSTNPRRQERAQGPLVIDRFSHLNAVPKAEA